MSRTTKIRLVVAAGGVGVLLAGCGSGSKTSAASTPASSGSSASSATSGAEGTVRAASGPLGSYLTDAAGRTLYMFAADKGTKSACSSTCTVYWPPLTVTGTPTAGAGVTAGDLGTVHRADGATQVSYAGHLLYYFKLDTAPGQTKGQGNTGFGAKWWLLTPAGQPITGAAPAGSAANSPAGGGYGAGY